MGFIISVRNELDGMTEDEKTETVSTSYKGILYLDCDEYPVKLPKYRKLNFWVRMERVYRLSIRKFQ